MSGKKGAKVGEVCLMRRKKQEPSRLARRKEAESNQHWHPCQNPCLAVIASMRSLVPRSCPPCRAETAVHGG